MRQTKNATSTTVIAPGPARLDQLLATLEGIKSRVAGRKLIESGRVSVNGKVLLKVSTMLSTGDRIDYAFPPPPAIPDDQDHDAPPLVVLYDDDDCFVIDKPAALAMHPGSGMTAGTRTVLDALKPLFRKRGLPFSASTVLVHRLDKDTTGCLLIAKTPTAQRTLQKQFEERTVRKTYLAVVHGRPAVPSATIDAPIGRHVSERTRMSIHRAVRSRAARTTYRTVRSGGGMTLLECDLHTGRTHQIRVHLAGIGHPIVGDTTYGHGAAGHPILLHAWRLQFQGATGRSIEVEAPVPEAFRALLDRWGLEY